MGGLRSAAGRIRVVLALWGVWGEPDTLVVAKDEGGGGSAVCL